MKVGRILGVLGRIKERILNLENLKNSRQDVEQSRKKEEDGLALWCSQGGVFGKILSGPVTWLSLVHGRVLNSLPSFKLFMPYILFLQEKN